ncbi:MAG: protein adenylyltransferase SelO [Hyphomicrobiaceae bacterium]
MNVHIPNTLRFEFDNTYARDLEGFYTPWQAEPVPEPSFLAFNRDLATELGLDVAALETEAGAAIFAGNETPHGSAPLAQAYAGHQFGGFSPKLGDGRAILLGEVLDTRGNRRDIQLKGSGRTPFSRGGDGKAAVGPVLREYLIGEAMHALSIPTTRALAAVSTGEPVLRELPLPGAILTRVAASHIRVGTFQYFAVRKDWAKIKQLADYVITRHYPEITGTEIYGDINPYVALFHAVSDAQARLVAKWMHVGFIHGVMNTDNMSISGETIDYGPCAFMDRYGPDTVFSSIDTHGRYAFANQPVMAQWNLTRFAETLLMIADPDVDRATEILTEAIHAFATTYQTHWLAGMRAKLGIMSEAAEDLDLVNNLFSAMHGQGADYTLAFRRLSDSAQGNDAPLTALFDDETAIADWLQRWRSRLARDEISPEVRVAAMEKTNPLYIPRNRKVEEALSAAVERNDLAPFNQLLDIVRDPFTFRAGLEDYTKPAPRDGAPYRTFCGT